LSSAGRITPGVEVYIANDSGRPLPPGETGEIVIRCRDTVQGYYLNPDDTAAEFTNGTWKSGDLGYIDDGGYLSPNLHWRARRTDTTPCNAAAGHRSGPTHSPPMPRRRK
jgi:non-ribosomal peptide synthetase component E (peptide arylation enzyme)